MLSQAALILSATIAVGSATGRDCTKEVRFIGFSADESMAAWHLATTCADPAGRYLDQYSLVRVVDTQSNLTINHFRASPIRRSMSDGRRAMAPAEALARDNPPWSEATPKREWKLLARDAHFSAVAVRTEDAMVGVLSDPDVSLEATSEDDAACTFISGQKGRALGYNLTLVDERRINLGRFRQEGEPGQIVSATVRVMRSASGDHLAVLNRFAVTGDGASRHLSYGKVIKAGSKPRHTATAMASAHSRSSMDSLDPFSDPSLALAEQLHFFGQGAY